MELPSIEGKIRRRPGPGKKTKQSIYVPDEKKYPKFWRDWYRSLDEAGVFSLPFENAEEKINPFFGYYGFRWHPVSKEPESFHTGVDFSSSIKNPVNAILGGILEYSGFDLVNGNYVMLSHPDIRIEGGCRLMSLYMHMRSNVVKFTSYQKMLREISLHSYPEIKIKKEETIGEVGDSGNIEGHDPRLHLQIQLHRKKGGVVALDPARILGILPKDNMTSLVKDKEEFEAFRKDKLKSIKEWGLESCWE